MLNHKTNYKTILALGLLLAVAIIGLSTTREVIKAEDSDARMRTLLQRLDDNGVSFVISFVMPIVTDTYWRLPGEIKDGGNIIGRRFIREIGDDFICIDEIGQGATDHFCVPFSNIAYIDYY